MVLKRIQADLVNVSEFAKLADVTRATVYTRIEDRDIIPVLVGKNKHLYISWNTYKDMKFPMKEAKEKFISKKLAIEKTISDTSD